jgi:hypothetical protein
MRATDTISRAILAGWVTLLAGAGQAAADRIRLRGGGEIRGVILPDPSEPGRLRVQTETGTLPLTLTWAQVVEVIAEADPLDAYFARKGATPETAASQYELGVWCEERKLRGLAEVHYHRAVELDPQHAEANRKLGHVKHDGKWMTYDAMRRAQGLVQYRGRWIAQEEYAREAASASQAAESASRVRQLIPLRQGLKSADAAISQEAERELSGFRDPASVPALVQVFGRDDAEGRVRLARLLGEIPGPEARQALVERALRESDPAVHLALTEELARRAEPEATQALLKALGEKDRARVGRAARTLAELGVASAVPRLIPLLVKVERRPVFVRSRSAPPLVTPGGAPMGVIGSYAGPTSWPVLTGPSVAPGAVAFGASGFPAPGDPSASMWVGGGGPARRPSVRMLTRVERSADVHEALVALTGQDFGFDPAAWKQWLARNPSSTSPPPTRRVPQP